MPKRPAAASEDLAALLKRPEAREVPLSLRMRQSDLDALKAIGKEMGCGFGTVARLIVEKYLAEKRTKRGGI